MFGLGIGYNGQLTNASMAYLPYFGLNPYGITNFGGDIQIFPVEPFQQGQVGLAFNQVAQSMGWPARINSGYQTSPMINTNAVIAGVSALAAESLNNMSKQELNATSQMISSQKTKLQSELQATDLKPEDKTKIEEQIKELEKYEKEIEDLKKANLDPQTAYQKAHDIRIRVSEYISTGKVESTSAQGSTTNSSGTGSSNGASGTSGATPTDETGSSPASTNTETEQNHVAWVRAMHDAMWGPGTKNDVFEAGCEEITKDNVIQKMIQWHMLYPNESFMEAFMADADSSQKAKYGKQILYALADKAMELGIDLTKDQDYIKCQKEMDSWFYIDNGVADNFNALIKKIAAKMGHKFEYTPYSMGPK